MLRRPLSQGIDLKIKSKIWSEEYIDLGSLYFKSGHSKMEAVQGENNVITFVQKDSKHYFKSFNQWISASHIFVAIYCEKSPDQAPLLMKYMATVQKLNSDVRDKAAYHYDEHFRRWCAESPSIMPWDRINAELHSEALQIGLRKKLYAAGADKIRKTQNSPFVGKAKSHALASTTTTTEIAKDSGANSRTYAPIATGTTIEKPANLETSTKNLGKNRHQNKPQNQKSDNQNVVTPINVKALSSWLENYDEQKFNYLLQGFSFGFKIPYHGSRQFRQSKNLKSALDNMDILRQKIE